MPALPRTFPCEGRGLILLRHHTSNLGPGPGFKHTGAGSAPGKVKNAARTHRRTFVATRHTELGPRPNAGEGQQRHRGA